MRIETTMYLLAVYVQMGDSWDFPGGPVVKTPHFHGRGHGFDPWWGN